MTKWLIFQIWSQISIKEFMPVLIATLIWGHKRKGHNVLIYCDNEAVVFVLNKHYSRDSYLAHMLHTLLFIEAHFQFQIKAAHIPGVHNTLADLLSRNQVAKFRTQLPNADIFLHVFPYLSYSGYWTWRWTGHQNVGPNCLAFL